MKKLKDLIKKSYSFRRYCAKVLKEDLTNIRNIGILAHIDAGKTTTTERMLYYSGRIDSMGEVHRGNTVTDFLDQERERGITISSAAVSFSWRNHQFNLIDTPGHIDFTMEVERCLNVLDGAVVILDGSAGVEAQTVTVWRQADRYNLPRVIYLNKMDRTNASLEINVGTLQKKFNAHPFLIHMPIYDENQQLEGVIDLITMVKTIWEKGDGRTFHSRAMQHTDDPGIWAEAMTLRSKLVEKLSDNDDHVAEKVIQSGTLDIPGNIIFESVKKMTLSQKGFPVVCGSSYKNIGVQLLMDAVVNFLPSPVQRNQLISHCFKGSLCARAFKVIHDNQKKPITFFRVYSGSFVKGQKIYNIQQERTEQVTKLMIPYADETIEVDTVSSRNIAAVGGLKETVTGDFVTSNANTTALAMKKLEKYKKTKGGLFHENFGQNAKVPFPVFYCSIEAPSQALQSNLDAALRNLQREDPSLLVTRNAITGQTILGGMGQLHLDIIKNRITSEYKINAELGTLEIAYQEIPKEMNVRQTVIVDNKIGNSHQYVKIVMSLQAKTENERCNLLLDKSPESSPNISNLNLRYLLAIEQGINRALRHGPKLSCPIVNTNVMLHWCETRRGTAETVVGAAASQCVQKILKFVGTVLLEPIMLVEVVSDTDKSSAILADLTRRRGIVRRVSSRGLQQVIEVEVPLVELLDYATDLRHLTSGSGTFTMELEVYQSMTPTEEAKAIKRVTGFDPI